MWISLCLSNLKFIELPGNNDSSALSNFNIFDHYFFKYSFWLSLLYPLLGHLQCGVCCYTWWCPTGLFIFLHSFFFLLLRLHNCSWTIFRVTNSFFCCSALLLRTFTKYFVSVIILVSTTISIWLLFVISISLLIFSLHWDFVLLVSFIIFDHI